MAYTYKKLTDVELVESAVEPNLLIEEDGDIKKIPASNVAVPQVKANWEETDASSPAFIMNKPDLSQAGRANVVTYTVVSGALQLGGVATNAQAVVNEWDNGSILRINDVNRSGSVVEVSYILASGTVSTATLSYYSNSAIKTITI